MKKPDPVRDVEVMVSLRHGPYDRPCAFVSATLVRSSGQTSLAYSHHLTGSPERIIDSALALAREQMLELWLADREPF